MVVANMKLKIKVATKMPESVPCESLKQVEVTGSHDRCISGNGILEAQFSHMKNHGAYSSDGTIASGIDGVKPKSSLLGVKRGLEEMVEIPNGKRLVPNGKRLKMDRSMALKCSLILKKLMKHHGGWIFNQPVDPIALNIPDYFSIISKPMDLGTIKSKLDKNVYSFTEEFESDVRLTFSNAMLYNPPTNEVHLIAKELNAFFDAQWKPVGINMNRQSIDLSHEIAMIGNEKKIYDTGRSCLKTSSAHVDLLPLRSTPLTDKMKPKESMAEASLRASWCDMKPAEDGKVKNIRPTKTSIVYGKVKNIRPSKTSVDMDLDGAESCLKEESSFPSPACIDLLPKGLGQLKVKMKPKDVKGPLITKKVPCSNPKAALHRDSKAALASSFSNGKVKNTSPSKDIFIHDLDSDGAASFLEEESSFPSPPRVDLFPKGLAQSKEKVKCEDPHIASNRKKVPRSNPKAAPCSDSKTAANFLDAQARNCSKSQMNRCDPNSNGAVSNLDEHAYSGTNVTPASTVARSEGSEISAFEIHLMPNKALRVAMLKTRFADTILRAQRKTLLDPGDRVDAVKRQQERESLERRQCEEKARIEAQIKASQMQRQREREAARIALEKMEKSVDIDDNFYMLREIQMLIGDCMQTCFSHGYHGSNAACNQFKNGKVRSPLERLGLFIKPEYTEDDDDEEAPLKADLEDGELLF